MENINVNGCSFPTLSTLNSQIPISNTNLTVNSTVHPVSESISHDLDASSNRKTLLVSRFADLQIPYLRNKRVVCYKIQPLTESRPNARPVFPTRNICLIFPKRLLTRRDDPLISSVWGANKATTNVHNTTRFPINKQNNVTSTVTQTSIHNTVGNRKAPGQNSNQNNVTSTGSQTSIHNTVRKRKAPRPNSNAVKKPKLCQKSPVRQLDTCTVQDQHPPITPQLKATSSAATTSASESLEPSSSRPPIPKLILVRMSRTRYEIFNKDEQFPAEEYEKPISCVKGRFKRGSCVQPDTQS